MKLKKEVETRGMTAGQALVLSRLLIVAVMLASFTLMAVGIGVVKIVGSGIDMLNARHPAPRVFITPPKSCPVPPKTLKVCDTRDPACKTRYRIERSCTERCHTNHHRGSSLPNRFPPPTFDYPALWP